MINLIFGTVLSLFMIMNSEQQITEQVSEQVSEQFWNHTTLMCIYWEDFDKPHGFERRVATASVPTHLEHGDCIGPCNQSPVCPDRVFWLCEPLGIKPIFGTTSAYNHITHGHCWHGVDGCFCFPTVEEEEVNKEVCSE